MTDIQLNGFRKLQRRLRAEGWLVEWAMPCCTACAWLAIPSKHEEGPFKGQDVDFSKVLFNDERDCDAYIGDDIEVGKWEEWMERFNESIDAGTWKEFLSAEKYYADESAYEKLVLTDTKITFPPEVQRWSWFSFDGSDEGVENLKSVLPVIEKCGCVWKWDETAKSKIHISWEKSTDDSAMLGNAEYLEDGTPFWPDLDMPLFCAAQDGNADEVRRLLESAAYEDLPDLMDSFTCTFTNDKRDAFESFVEHGLDILATWESYDKSIAGNEPINSIMAAAGECSLWALKRLLELGVDPSYSTPSGITAVDVARNQQQTFREDPTGFWAEQRLSEQETEKLLNDIIDFLESHVASKTNLPSH